MDPIKLKSGAVLTVAISSFATGNKLMKTVARELSGVDFNLELRNLDELSEKDINVLKNVVFRIIQSDAIEQALLECMKKCLYNDQRITAETFEMEDARPDYLPVAWEVMKANLRPFFSGIDLSSLTSAKPPSNARKSASPSIAPA